jgi:alkylation response protein AidB-like acyl-CoA dehydrogenase
MQAMAKATVNAAAAEATAVTHAGGTARLRLGGGRLDMRQPGVTIRPLAHMGGEAEFFQVFLDGATVPDTQRVGAEGAGWNVAQATLSGERQMVSGSGSGGVDRRRRSRSRRRGTRTRSSGPPSTAPSAC